LLFTSGLKWFFIFQPAVPRRELPSFLFFFPPFAGKVGMR